MANDTLSQLRAGTLAGATRLDLSCELTEFPREIFDLADTLEVLNLTQNQLSSLPDDFARLSKLRILFVSENRFRHLPAVLGDCAQLSMIGFKANQIETVDAAAFPPRLRWLILTDNRIRQLPATLGQCQHLQKLMLAGNQLAQLPDELAACVKLELLRLSANQFHALPAWLYAMPRLCWLALAGNPMSAPQTHELPSIADIDWASLQMQERLGEGASGIISKALWTPANHSEARPVAVKIFKGEVTSDGLPASEMAASMAVGAHPHLVEVLGRITQHPTGAEGLVMALITPEFANLAGPPGFDTCTRDVYPEGTRFTLPVLRRIAWGIASAAEQLHARGILHGDLYAHNVLWNAQGDCLLGDFGAASFYPVAGGLTAHPLQRLEVCAFGCLLGELLERCDLEPGQNMAGLRALHQRCAASDVATRPSFADVRRALSIATA